MSYLTNIVGQLLHENVARDAVALVKKHVPDCRRWPEDTVFSESMITGKYPNYTAEYQGTRISQGCPFDPERQELSILIRVLTDGTVKADCCLSGAMRFPFEGRLELPLAYAASWETAEQIHCGNESWARGLWYSTDLLAWHQSEIYRLLGRPDGFVEEQDTGAWKRLE